MGHYAYLCGVERSKVDQVKSKVSKKLKFDLISFIADRGGAFE